jgi:hypothetical protein
MLLESDYAARAHVAELIYPSHWSRSSERIVLDVGLCVLLTMAP